MEALNYKTGELFVGVTHGSGTYIVCANLNTRKSCGSWKVGRGTSYIQLTNFNTIGDKYYVLNNDSELVCFDIVKREVCGKTSYPGSFNGYGTSAALGSQLYFSPNSSQLYCHDANTGQPCAGWRNEGVNAGGGAGAYPIVNGDGSPRGACTNSGACVSMSGEKFLAPAGYRTFLATNSFLGSAYHNLSGIAGAKLYAAGGATVECWDAAKDASCGKWVHTANMTPYTTRFDPTRQNCLMVIGDAAQAMIFDVTDGGPCKTVSTPKVTEMDFDPIKDYFQCDGGRANVAAWGKLRLSPSLPWGGANGLDRVTATIKDGNGKLLPAEYKPVRNFAFGTYQMEIGTGPNAIPYAKYPVLKIGIEFSTPGSQPLEATFGVDLTYEGDPIQVCVASKAPAAPDCQTGASITLKSRAVDQAGPGYAEEQTATKIMSPGGLTTGYAAFSSATTPRLNTKALSPLDPRTQIVQGRWSLQYFSGDLWAFNLTDAGQIIGSPYQSAQANTPAPALRKMYTALPTATGVAMPIRSLEWAQLAAAQQQALNNNDNGVADGRGSARVSYLRGTDASPFRARNGLTLGPVINSAPVVLPTWAAESRLEANFQGFTDYRRDKAKMRAHPLAIYGGNDGALHAFEAKGDALSEAWTFVPDVMLRRASRYSDPNPAEIRNSPYFVDNVPIVGHANTGTDAAPDWRAVAVVLYGRGARAITALDVTRTDIAHADSKGVLFEYTHSSDPALKDLGYIISQPDAGSTNSSAQLVKLTNARSAVLVGNGINSHEATAGSAAASGTGMPVLYAFYLDGKEKKFHRWSVDNTTWAGADAEPGIAFDNGLSTPTPLDFDNDGKVDVVYAGDLQGNLWRFDVTNPDKVSVTRLFKTYDKTPSDAQQPITQAPFVTTNTEAKDCGAANAPAHAKRCWQVVFSTGANISPLLGSPNVAPQAIYGILDKGKGGSVGQGNLTRISYETNRIVNGVEYRALKPTTVKYSDNQLGWRADLQAFEHGVGAPRLQPTGLVMFSSVRPTTPNKATNICIGPRSWLNEVDPLHGYSPIVAFDTNGDGNIDGQDRFDPDSSKPISPTSMAVSGSQFGAPTLLRSASSQSQQMSLLLPSLGQDTGQANSWSGGNSGGGNNPAPGSNSAALTHSNKGKFGRMTWREKY
jgi:hypothetical protein